MNFLSNKQRFVTIKSKVLRKLEHGQKYFQLNFTNYTQNMKNGISNWEVANKCATTKPLNSIRKQTYKIAGPAECAQTSLWVLKTCLDKLGEGVLTNTSSNISSGSPSWLNCKNAKPWYTNCLTVTREMLKWYAIIA